MRILEEGALLRAGAGLQPEKLKRGERQLTAFADIRVQCVFSHHLQISCLVQGLNKVTATTTLQYWERSCPGQLCILQALLIFSCGKNTRSIKFPCYPFFNVQFNRVKIGYCALNL